MPQNILILNGHPDAASTGLCHALARAYEDGARSAGHAVRRLDVAKLDFGLLHSQAAFEKDAPPAAIAAAQESIRWSNHVVVIFPMWLRRLLTGARHAGRPGRHARPRIDRAHAR